MYTLLLEGVPALPDDARIERALQLQDGWPGGARRECRIGISGPDGKVYRSVVARSLSEIAATHKLLLGFGFVEGPPELIFRAVYHRSLEWTHFRGAHAPLRGGEALHARRVSSVPTQAQAQLNN